MQANVFLQITLSELETLIEQATERSVQKVLGKESRLEDETLLSTEEVISEFKVSRVTLNNYRKANKLIPFSKAGKQNAYRRCDCQKAFMYKIKMNH